MDNPNRIAVSGSSDNERVPGRGEISFKGEIQPLDRHTKERVMIL
jgi:hypothetical protein